MAEVLTASAISLVVRGVLNLFKDDSSLTSLCTGVEMRQLVEAGGRHILNKKGGGLPANHDLMLTNRRALQAAALFCAHSCEQVLKADQGDYVPLLQRMVAHYKDGFDKPLLEWAQDDTTEERWLRSYSRAVCKSCAFGRFVPPELLPEENLLNAFGRDTDPAKGAAFAKSLESWTKSQIDSPPMPNIFQDSLEAGFLVNPDKDERVSFYQAYLLFLREFLKTDKKAYRASVAETILEFRNFVPLWAKSRDELEGKTDAVLARLETLGTETEAGVKSEIVDNARDECFAGLPDAVEEIRDDVGAFFDLFAEFSDDLNRMLAGFFDESHQLLHKIIKELLALREEFRLLSGDSDITGESSGRFDLGGVSVRTPQSKFSADLTAQKAGDIAYASSGIPLIWIPPDRFMMGLTIEEATIQDSKNAHLESPQMAVGFSHGFWIGQTPITQRQFEEVTGGLPDLLLLPERRHLLHPNRPVTYVSWEDSDYFCKRLNSIEINELPTGFVFRLPTEAEWEFSCRAGRTHPPKISGILDSSGSSNLPELVGHSKGHPWGIQDMQGNVLEWCGDYFDHYPEKSEPQIDRFVETSNPKYPNQRVLRGGSFKHSRRWTRATARTSAAEKLPRSDGSGRGDRAVGFRIVLGSANFS